MRLTKNQQAILGYLKREGEWRSPTNIGLDVGGVTSGGLQRHSSWASPIRKRLVGMGLAVRNKHGWYRIGGINELD